MTTILWLLLRIAIAINALIVAFLVAATIWEWCRDYLWPWVQRQRVGVVNDAQLRRDLEEFEVEDGYDAATGSHPRHRGFAPAAPEGLGPAVRRRTPSRLVPLWKFDRAAQDAINEVLGKRGHRR